MPHMPSSTHCPSMWPPQPRRHGVEPCRPLCHAQACVLIRGRVSTALALSTNLNLVVMVGLFQLYVVTQHRRIGRLTLGSPMRRSPSCTFMCSALCWSRAPNHYWAECKTPFGRAPRSWFFWDGINGVFSNTVFLKKWFLCDSENWIS
jgi:hypothetical protein